MRLDSPIGSVALIGPGYVKRLKKLNIKKVQDLMYHFPHRYRDYSLISKIGTVQEGETITLQGQVLSIKNIYTTRGKKIQTAVLSDGENRLNITWFNMPYLIKTIPQGTWVSVSGKVGLFGGKKTLVSPEYEKITQGDLSQENSKTIHTGRLVPVYPETYGISSKWLRSRVAFVLPQLLDQTQEYLPEKIRKQNGLINLVQALQNIHFPQNNELMLQARQRLAFDELFLLQIKALFRKKNWRTKKLAHRLKLSKDKISQFLKNLPFELTNAQKRASREILKDLILPHPMNRLLEGDVGSGKTVVAALSMYVAYFNGFQSAIMAPTQILAMQHYKTLKSILGPLGVKTELITSAKRKVTKDSQKVNVFVGTHALIQNKVNFKKLSLIVIDEQHRFGVSQRALLAQKASGRFPHVLTMTATPIPRTIALTFWGDLNLSVLDELPKGRQRIKTWVVPPKKRESAYSWIRQRVKSTKEQAFIVCPLIEESQVETLKSVKAATVEFERLKKTVFPDLKLGLLHGKIKQTEKEKVMQKMKKGKLDILVTTPVVEVGIDIPSAAIMLIEAAERFGLAGLHQLRGRVGRGKFQSYCLLFTQNRSAKVASRLKALEKNLSGPELAQLDLNLRGPGEMFGTQQHGFPELKVASFSQTELIQKARTAAEEIIKNIYKYPQIKTLFLEADSIAPN